MLWLFAIILILAVAVGVAWDIARGITRRRRFAPFADRRCGGRRWLRAFPDAGKEDIREFLQILIEGFALRRKHLLKFRPDDRVMDIYFAINPPKWTIGDEMELECFVILLKRRYGVALESIWRDDITLGEVFGAVRAAQSAGAS